MQVSRIMAVAAARYGGSKSPAPGATALDIVKRLLLVPQLLHPDFLTLLAFADAIVDTHPFGTYFSVLATCRRACLASPVCTGHRRWLHDDVRRIGGGDTCCVMAWPCAARAIHQSAVGKGGPEPMPGHFCGGLGCDVGCSTSAFLALHTLYTLCAHQPG